MMSSRVWPVGILLALLTALASAGADPARVVIETELGDIEIEVYENEAPLSAGSFLAYVDAGYYENAAFYRTVTRDNDRGSPGIEVIQGGVLDRTKTLAPVAHESTHESGILHEDGVVSLARAEPGTASGAAFFICVGRQPGLDFGAERNPDKLGFAAFGRVVAGMEVVMAIHQSDANGHSESDYTRGQILTRFVDIRRAYRK